MAQAQQAIQAGTDFLICHQHPLSIRFTSIQTTAEIVRASSKPVWVQFENDHVAVIHRIIADVKPAGLIFNGNELPAFCAQFALPWIKRISMKNGFSALALQSFSAARFVILDAYAPPTFGEYGKSPYLWGQLDGLDLEKVILAGQLPLGESKLESFRFAGFEWGAELEQKPWVWDPEKLGTFSKLHFR